MRLVLAFSTIREKYWVQRSRESGVKKEDCTRNTSFAPQKFGDIVRGVGLG